MSGPATRLAFAGTPDFAVPALHALLTQTGYEVCVVYTQPDRPAGRGRSVRPSPVKQLAIEQGLEVRQPLSAKDPEVIEELTHFNLDLIIVAAYGQILGTPWLQTPRLGCINIHASLLPRWRGAAPIQRAILAGDKETGITLMQIVKKLDAGPMIKQAKCPIFDDDTSLSLHERLSTLGAQCLTDTLPDYLEGRLSTQEQDENQVTYAEKITKVEAEIDWTQPAAITARRVRAFNPKPIAHTFLLEKQMRIWAASAENGPLAKPPGTVLKIAREGIAVATGEGILTITRLQLPGKRPVHCSEFVNANPHLAF